MDVKSKQPIRRTATASPTVALSVDIDAQAEQQASAPVPIGVTVKKTGVGAAISGIERLLTQQDLESDGAKKIFLAQYDEIMEENEELKEFRDRYYEAEKERAILQEQLVATREGLAKDGIMLALAGVLITLGVALPSLFTSTKPVIENGSIVLKSAPATGAGLWSVMGVLIVCGVICLAFPLYRVLKSGAKP